MKKLALTLILQSAVLILQSRSQPYGWVDLSAHIPDQLVLKDVHFIGDHGWIVGANTRIYYTSNGGTTFSSQRLPDTLTAGISNSIFVRSLWEAYTVTSTGKVFRSTDPRSGQWNAVPPGTSVPLFSVNFPPSGSRGYACGNAGRVYRIDTVANRVTLDSVLGSGTLTSICFPVNSDTGWVIGGTMLHRKLGSGWVGDQLYSPESRNAVHFIDNFRGWAVGQNGSIIHTTNGQLWNVPQASPATSTLHDVFFLNELEGWAVGNGVILHTTNSGTHWAGEAQSLTSGRTLTAVFPVNNTTVYVCGDRTFLKYTQVTDVAKRWNLPQAFALYQNYPNPFNPSTNIKYQIPSTNLVTLKVFDVLGREVATLVNEVKQPGTYTVQWGASSQASGVYFSRLLAGQLVETKKLLLIR